MFSQQINSCSRVKFCKWSKHFVIIFITVSVSFSSGCSSCMYSTDNLFYRDITNYHHLGASWMFYVVHGGAWIGYLHHLAHHQLCSPKRPTAINCTCKRCKTMVQCCQYQMSHPHYTIFFKFVMLTGEWNDDCFL